MYARSGRETVNDVIQVSDGFVIGGDFLPRPGPLSRGR
jgi:hypothetical protein